MDGSSEGKKSILKRIRRIGGSTRTLLIGVLALMLITGLVMAATSFDDFEDEKLDGWILGNNVTTTTQTTYNGSVSMQVNGDANNNAARWNISGNGDDNVTALVKPPAGGEVTISNFVDSNNQNRIRIKAGSNEFRTTSNSGTNDNFAGVSATINSEWYVAELYITADGSKTCGNLKDPDTGNYIVEGHCVNNIESHSNGDVRVWTHETSGYGYVDAISVNRNLKPAATYEVSGEVTDQDNKELSNVTVEVENQSEGVVATDTTGQLGLYNVSLENGTYNLTASKKGYANETKEVTVDGSEETINFQLTEFNASIKLKTRSYIDHGKSTPYSVIVTVNGDRKDVTGNSTVTSNDTSVVSVDDVKHELVATDDPSVNKRTFVRATWEDGDGNTYTTTRNVTVANLTVQNIGILPSFPRFSASIDDTSIQLIIIASGVGAAAALFATSFAGISAMTMIMLLGWLAGYTNNGMAIVTVLTAMFVGMNVAGNVDYTVRK